METCKKPLEFNKVCSCTTNEIPHTKIICVTGYSGSGKSTMIKLMHKYLPNSCFITKNDEITKIQNSEELEKEHGIPVRTKHIFDYFKEVVAIRENTDIVNIYNNIIYQTKFSKLISAYIEKRFEDKLAEILAKSTPDFVVLEWSSIPKFKIWNESDYRIIVKPAKWELLVENIMKRVNRTALTLDMAEVRNLGLKEIIENVQNITHEIINNYDTEYEQSIKNLCSELMKNQAND